MTTQQKTRTCTKKEAQKCKDEKRSTFKSKSMRF